MKESKKGVRCQVPGVSSATSDTSFVIPHSSLNTCPHKHKELRTLAHYVTVEVTALFCKDCGKQLTKEEWNV